MSKIKKAIKELKLGKPICIYSSKEGETDIVRPAVGTTWKDVSIFRRYAGGIISVGMHRIIADALEIEYDVVDGENSNYTTRKKLAGKYFNRTSIEACPNFANINIDHVDTGTGISCSDIALSIRELGKICYHIFNSRKKDEIEAIKNDFYKSFRLAGHLRVLISSVYPMKDRSGHMEMSMAMCLLAGIPPVITMSEMANPYGEKCLNKEEAEENAKNLGLVFISDEEIFKAYKKTTHYTMGLIQE